MIRTFLRFDLVEDGADAFVELFRQHRILETSLEQAGCLSAEMALSEDSSTATVTATWTDRDAYRRWTSRGDRGDLAIELNELLATPIGESTTGEICDVVWTGDGAPQKAPEQ